MPTARHVKAALDKAVRAHQEAHRGPVEAAGLQPPSAAVSTGTVDEGAYTEEGEDDGG